MLISPRFRVDGTRSSAAATGEPLAATPPKERFYAEGRMATNIAHLRDDKFVISCAARTGSTMLVLLLSSHPDILCHGEVYDQNDKVGWLAGRYERLRREFPTIEDSLWTYLTTLPAAFLYDVLFDRQNRRLAGFKYKTDEAFNAGLPHRADLQPLIARDTDIKIIRLRRRDLLAQFVSHQVVRRTGVTLLRGTSDAPGTKPFYVDPAVVVNYFQDVDRRDDLATEAYRDHRQFPVDYEDLAKPSHPVRDDLLDFLGVPRLPLTTQSRQILTNGYRLLLNLDEIMAALDAAGYAARIRLEARATASPPRTATDSA